MMNTIIKTGIVLGVCIMLIAVAGSGGSSDDAPTAKTVVASTSSETAETVRAVVDGYAPLVESTAGAVDVLVALAAPNPSFFDTWGTALTAICIVGLVLGIPSLALVLWSLIRSEILGQLVTALAIKRAGGGK